MDKDISVTLKVWRQRGPKEKGQFETYKIEKINQSVSFLEMLDILNEQLVNEGKEPIVFDHDCREGICGMCSLYVNGHPHGPATGATTCQLYMRRFHDGETITIEPLALTKNNLADIRSLSHVFDLSYQDQTMILRCSGAKHNLIRVLNYLQEQDIPFGRVFSELPTLNDVFLEITGKELRD